jgi:gliding motility-associated protein GldE
MYLIKVFNFGSCFHVLAVHFDWTSVVISVLIVVFLLLFSALISGSEAAFFSLSPSEKESIKDDETRSGKLVSKLLKTPKQLLATVLIANNFINVSIVIISSSLLSQFFDDDGANSTFRFIIDVFVITFVILIIGEVIPKIYANKNAMAFAKLMAIPLNFLNQLPPFSWLKQVLVNGTMLIQKNTKRKSVSISSDELEQALALTKEDNISEGEHKILEGIVKFGNTDVRQIMCPRMDVCSIQDGLEFKDVLDLIIEFGYSRVPVFNDNFDNITGILFIKDLLPHIDKGNEFEWKTLLRKPFFVPENKKIDDLLKEFQSKNVHMAIVVDEYGGSSGLVTLEDVLEEIVGDITDEYDEEEINFRQVDENTFVFEGRTALIDLYKILEIDGKDFENLKGESDTLGGFLTENAGRILKNNEYFICSNFKLIVESSDKKRIKSVKVVVLNESLNGIN